MRDLDLKLQISSAQAANGAYFVVPHPLSDERVIVYSFGTDFVF